MPTSEILGIAGAIIIAGIMLYAVHMINKTNYGVK